LIYRLVLRFEKNIKLMLILMFLDVFNVLILKIKKNLKKFILMYFQIKNTFKKRNALNK